MATYIPHTQDEVAGMLAFLGLTSVDQLFDVVPDARGAKAANLKAV